MTMAPLGTPVAVSIVVAVGVVVVATVGTLVATVLVLVVLVVLMVLMVLMAAAVPVLVLVAVAGELTAAGAGTRIVATSAATRPPARQRATVVNVVIGAPPLMVLTSFLPPMRDAADWLAV